MSRWWPLLLDESAWSPYWGILVLLAMALAVAAGSIIVTSYWLPAYFAFAVPSVGLAALRLVMEGGAEYISLAFLMGMYLVIITRVARVQHAAGQSLVRLRDENVDLVERLSAEKSAVEAANHELDQRVRERTAELLEEVEVRKAAEHRLEHLAHHDPLTGLPNRLAFGHQLDRAIAQASRRQRRLALLPGSPPLAWDDLMHDPAYQRSLERLP
jgi:predicted signal transduction protein with EAL and GGDEF domain